MTDLPDTNTWGISDVYLKNGLKEKKEGGRGGKEERENWIRRVRQGNWEEHIFKPMLIYFSSQTKQVHKGRKFSFFFQEHSESQLLTQNITHCTRRRQVSQCSLGWKQWLLKNGHCNGTTLFCSHTWARSDSNLHGQTVSKVLPTLVQTFSLGADEITWTGSSQEDYRQPDASGRLGRRELPSNAIKNIPFVQMC